MQLPGHPQDASPVLIVDTYQHHSTLSLSHKPSFHPSQVAGNTDLPFTLQDAGWGDGSENKSIDTHKTSF